MGIFATIKDPELEAARQSLVAKDIVCPACKAPFTTSADTLHAINPQLGMVMHKCPACGHELWSIKLPGT